MMLLKKELYIPFTMTTVKNKIQVQQKLSPTSIKRDRAFYFTFNYYSGQVPRQVSNPVRSNAGLS